MSDISDARGALVLAAQRLARAQDAEPHAHSDDGNWYSEELVDKAARTLVIAIDNALSGQRSGVENELR